MFRHILVPLDGSACAEHVLPVAAKLARASQGTLTLLRVVDLTHHGLSYGIAAPYIVECIFEDDLSTAWGYLDRWRFDRALEGVDVQRRVVSGDPAEAIIAQAAKPPIDLVAISSHGYTGMKRWFLGSVAEKVARHALVPVFILRPPKTLPTHQSLMRGVVVRALVPLASPRSLDALVPAAEIVAALSPSNQGELHLAQMIGTHDLARVTRREAVVQAAEQNLASLSQSIRDGLIARFGPELHPALFWSVSLTDDIAEGIVHLAEYGDESMRSGATGACDLIALTTHGLGGMHHWPVGSIAERVLRSTSLPILMVRPEEMIAKQHQQHQPHAASPA